MILKLVLQTEQDHQRVMANDIDPRTLGNVIFFILLKLLKEKVSNKEKIK